MAMTIDTINALIIDDDRDAANFLRIVLEQAGFQCEVIHSAKAALALLASVEPHLILLDMRLGTDISGGDLLYQIRSNPRFNKTRVIVVTAYPSLVAPVDQLTDLILYKPVEIEQLKTLASRIVTQEASPYSFRDPSTKLYHLPFFMARLEHAFEREKRRLDFRFATLVIEFMVQLPEVELFLEEHRETMLQTMAGRLLQNSRPTDTFARMDSKRIVALFEELKQPRDVEIILQRLRQELSRPLKLAGQIVALEPLFGAVLNDADFKSAPEILQAAVQAIKLSIQGIRAQT